MEASGAILDNTAATAALESTVFSGEVQWAEVSATFADHSCLPDVNSPSAAIIGIAQRPLTKALTGAIHVPAL